MKFEAEKKMIVLSGVSIFDGGALTILNLVVNHLSKRCYQKYRIIFLLHDQTLIAQSLPAHIEVLEINKKRVSWAKRLYYEYFYFYFLSKKLKPFLWISLHELTPIVKAERRAVYCHNANLVSKHSFRMLFFEPTIALFKSVFYLLNRFNIKKNDFVIVQQFWMKTAFHRRFKISKEKIIVARPNFELPNLSSIANNNLKTDRKRLIYPSICRSSKNFEVILKTVKILEQQKIDNFEVLFTFKGDENRYAQQLIKEYGHLKNVKFIGGQTHKEIMSLYASSDYLIFSSLVESWGLPITEFKLFDKPMILADLPYARETVGNYEKVIFFNPNNVDSLFKVLKQVIVESPVWSTNNTSLSSPMKTDDSWSELFETLLK